MTYMQYFEIRHLFGDILQKIKYLYFIIVQIQRLQIGNVFGDDIDDGQKHYGFKQGAKRVLQIGIGVELCQIQSLCHAVITFRHDHLHFFFKRRRHIYIRSTRIDSDEQFKSVW